MVGNLGSKTEKATINVGVMELAQIDLLVDSLLYTNRSDFIRTAIRKQLEQQKEDIQRCFDQRSQLEKDPETKSFHAIGIMGFTKKELLSLKEQNKKMNVLVTGIFVIGKSVEIELLRETISSVKVYGKIIATPEQRKFINENY